MGFGWTTVRHLDHLVSGGRRLLHRLHCDRRPGAGVRRRSLRLLRASLYDRCLSDRVRHHATAVEERSRQWSRHCGRRCQRHLQLARTGACSCIDRYCRDHAVHRVAAHRHGRGDQGHGPNRRTADRRCVCCAGAVHLQLRPARSGADRLRQRHHDLYCGPGGGCDRARETRRLWRRICCGG